MSDKSILLQSYTISFVFQIKDVNLQYKLKNKEKNDFFYFKFNTSCNWLLYLR